MLVFVYISWFLSLDEMGWSLICDCDISGSFSLVLKYIYIITPNYQDYTTCTAKCIITVSSLYYWVYYKYHQQPLNWTWPLASIL